MKDKQNQRKKYRSHQKGEIKRNKNEVRRKTRIKFYVPTET